MCLPQCRPTGPFSFLATSCSGGIRMTCEALGRDPEGGCRGVSLFPKEACRQTPSSERVRGQQGISAGDGWVKPHIWPPNRLSWVTSSSDSSKLRWSTLLAEAVQVEKPQARHGGARHLHGRPGLGVVSLQGAPRYLGLCP